MTTPDKIRLTIDLTTEQDICLEQLKKSTGKTSKSSVVREALRIYEYLTTRVANGANIELEKYGKVEKLVILGLMHVNDNDKLADW